MFINFKNNISEDVKITIQNNDVKVNDGFIVIEDGVKLNQKQFIIQNNNITFQGESQFIVDKNANKSDFYTNLQHCEIPRQENEQNSVVLFVNSKDNSLNYQLNEEVIKINQGVTNEYSN